MKKVTEEKEASAKENSGTENKKKLNIKVYNVLLLALLGIIGALFVSVIIPAQNATKKYNIAVEAYNKAVEEYNEVAVKTSLVNIDGLLTKADALNDVSESYFAIIKSVINGNNKGKILKDVATLEKMTNVLALAAENGLESVAFCCISTGEFHFPNEKAAQIAVATVKEFLKQNTSVRKVIFNVFKDLDKAIYEGILQ